MSSNPFPQHGEVASLMRAMDWSEVSLGCPSTWPPSLHTVLRLMLSSRYAMWLGWGDDLIFFYNDAYRDQTLGKKHPWALGRPAREVWAEIWAEVAPRVDQVLATGEATWDSGLLLFLERNGFAEETYHTFSYSPVFDDDGHIRGLFCVVIEETERVIGERKSVLQRDLGSALSRVNTTAEVLLAMEACLTQEARPIPFSLTYLFDDEAKEARLVARTGIDASHPATRDVISLKEEDHLWGLSTVWATARALEIPLDPEKAWPSGPWKNAPQRSFVVPIPRAGQNRPAGAFVAGLNPHRPFHASYRSFIELFVGQIGAGIDNARAYEVEKQRAEALAQIDRAKTLFFSNVSHEFRTPLTLMLGPTEDALASPERALQGESLETVHRNELRLLKLVNALLDFSRIEAGRAEVTYEATDLASLTTDLASAFRSAMERGGLRYDVDCEPLGVPVYVDRDMWEKIVLNLLSNALKFTLQGFVRLSLRDASAHVELEVEDSGPGIPPDELPRMFERFHRIEGTPARTHEGSGIGLALVRDLVNLHGGTIGVTSQPGAGARFVVRIPKGTAHLPLERVRVGGDAQRPARPEPHVVEALRWLPGLEDSAEEDPGLGAAQAGVAASRPRILVVDDNADMRGYLARLLRSRWVVETANDGVIALERIRADPPDVVIADVMMPRLDGFGLLRSVRENRATKTLPVLLLSARAGEEAIDEGLRAGANDYLIKPFSARELIGRVASQLTIAEIRREAEAEKEGHRRVVESLFMSVPAGIALIRGPKHVIDFANPMALHIWGKDSSVVGKPLLDAIPELEGQGLDGLIRSVVESGVPHVADERPVMFRRAGTSILSYLNFVYVPVLNQQGVADGVAAFGFDVTTQVVARQRAALGAEIGRAFVTNEALSSQLKRCCEALVTFGAASAQIWTFNPAHEVLEHRASAGEHTTSEPLRDRIPVGVGQLGRIAQRRRPEFSSATEDRESREPDKGLPVGHAFAGCPLMVGDRLLGVVAVGIRPNHAGAVQEILTSIADHIALGVERDDSERFRELFIGMLGHDLRNPLNAVNMATHLLTHGPVTPQQARTIQRIRTSASRMRRMIDQVLDFTRARVGGGIPIHREEANLREICHEAVEELASVHPERNIETDYRGDGRGAWDVDRLAQVFSNLLGNALAYGSADAPVRICVDATGENVECAVVNFGDPIPESVRDTLFDPFRRASHGKSFGTQGLGLGLFIAQQIVTAHGGSIRVTSSESEGTEFSFCLPRQLEER